MDTLDWAGVLALFLLVYLAGVITAHWLDQNRDATVDRRLELLQKRFERDIRYANTRVGELTLRTDRLSGAAHHHEAT